MTLAPWLRTMLSATFGGLGGTAIGFGIGMIQYGPFLPGWTARGWCAIVAGACLLAAWAVVNTFLVKDGEPSEVGRP